VTVNVCVNDTFCMYIIPHLHTKICFILYNTLEPDLSLHRLLEILIQEVFVSFFRSVYEFCVDILNFL
jgi:hypothetical protein